MYGPQVVTSAANDPLDGICVWAAGAPSQNFKQSLKTKNSKGGKLFKIAFYGNVQCEW